MGRTTSSDKHRSSATSAEHESKSPMGIKIAVEPQVKSRMGEGYPDEHGSGDTAVMEEEDGEGGGERRSRDKRKRKVNEKMLISRPSARLVDLTY